MLHHSCIHVCNASQGGVHLAPCKSSQSIIITPVFSPSNSKWPITWYGWAYEGLISIHSELMKMMGSIGVLVLPTDVILSKMLTFAPGKLSASYYTSFIHSPASGVRYLPSSLLHLPGSSSKHSTSSHHHQEETHRGSVAEGLRISARTLLLFPRQTEKSRRSRRAYSALLVRKFYRAYE